MTPYREYPVERFDPDSEFARMRIDILIRCKKWNVLIENKTKTLEHDSQTVVYLRAAKKSGRVTIPIFLTPNGHEAEDPAYITLSYPELTIAARNALKICSIPEEWNSVANDFLLELNARYLEPLLRNLKHAKSFREKQK